jgi:competence protein ComEC
MAMLQPMLFLAAVLLPVPDAARFVADACAPLMGLVDWLASAGASLPGATIPVLADRVSLAIACASVAGLAIACVSRHPGRALVGVAAGCAIVAWRPSLPAGAGVTELHMLDVGQGDAFALRTSRGRWILFDAGRDWEGGDEGRRTAIPYIASRGGRLHAFVLSHPHADHVGGAASVVAALRPALYVDPGYAGASRPYRASLDAAKRERVRWTRVRPGDSLVVDEAVITFLAPDPAWADSLDDPNEASTVARIRVGRVAMLMTGDAEGREEEWLLRERRTELRAHVLKVAHHGSRTSSSPAFLDAVQPRVALVSVGAGNVYGHPSAEVLRALALRGTIVLRADQHGTVVVRTDGQTFEVEAMGERWTPK